MGVSNKIKDKRAAYELVERDRASKTLDEIAKILNVTKQRVWQICRDLGVKDKPFRPRYSRLKSKSRLVADLN